MSAERIIVFLKAPRPGTVKTRLGLGGEAECSAYKRLLGVVLGKLDLFKGVELRFTPADAGLEVQGWSQPGWLMRPQGDGDLGARMNRAFSNAFAAGAKRVVILGSDCPYFEPEDLKTAWKELETADVVIGPAEDGGYWLIGLRESQPRLFSDIEWSSERVFAQTIGRAQDLGLKSFLLRTLSDIDTKEDWERFIAVEGRGVKRRQSPGAD